MIIKTRSQLFQEYRKILNEPENSETKGSYNRYCEIANTRWVQVNDVIARLVQIPTLIDLVKHQEIINIVNELSVQNVPQVLGTKSQDILKGA